MDSTSRPRVKNKTAAPVQISAEQLLREAVSHQETQLSAPTTRFADLEELHEYQGRKRKEFEDYLRRNRQNVNNFTRYASWELEQREFARARSIFERALDVHPTDIKLWSRYIDAELREKNIAHARNLLDRAVTILPRVNQLWFKYVRTEEALKDVARTREVYERWMKWQPDPPAWNAYINFELRYHEADNARTIYKRYTIVHPEPATWLKYARFEMEFGTVDLVRKVFEDSMEEQTTEDFSEKLVIEFARFETRLEEFERARAIYKHFLDRVPRSMAQNLHKHYLEFEKQYGDTTGIEHVVLEKRRVVYEKMLKENPKDYDTWLDLAKLEEVTGDLERIREVYERAIAEVPPRQEKRYWRRYIYIWLFYAAFEEIDVRDMQRVAEIYNQCLKLIPHKKFTFAKVWLAKAYFHIRQMDLKAARLTLGNAIGMCPKNKVYREYIALEVKLYEFGRCRKLYERWLVFDQSNMKAWKGFAELERALDDIPRARAIYEIAIDDSMNSKLDMPEVIWKDYIDMEIDEGEYDNARKLYERLLTKTSHVKVWISYAQFEVNITAADAEDDEDRPIPDEAKANARNIFERANKLYKEQGIKEDRVALLQAWKSFEETHGTDDDRQRLVKMMPQQVKKRRRLDDESFEEFVDWVFPADDEVAGKLAGLLARAKAWKEQKQGESSGNPGPAGDSTTTTAATAPAAATATAAPGTQEKNRNGRANLGLDAYGSDDGDD